MKVLVTGHLGYIGPVMVRLLKQAGHEVTGLDVGYFRDCMNAGQKLTAPDREINRDLRKVTPMDLAGQDAVIHLAGLSNDPMGELNPELTMQINLEASRRLAALAKESGVGRFVFASSCSLYGAAGESEKPLDETSAMNPVSSYAVCKAKTEELLGEMAGGGFSPVYLRNATAYGLSPRMRFDLVLANLTGWALATGQVKVLSDGTPWRPLVHIEDISRAALAALEAPTGAVHNQAFNVGRPDANYQVKDIAEAVANHFPEAELVITGENGGDPRSYRVDFTKIMTKLPGYEPQWTLERGCRELVDWVRGGGLGSEAFDSRNFVRLKQLKWLMETGAVDAELFPLKDL